MYGLLLNAVQRSVLPVGRKILLLSVNPELKSDFGHFLNYEKRINELCGDGDIFHHCLSSVKFETSRPYITGVFEHDSGHYCLYRKSAAGHEAKLTAELHRTILEWMDKANVVEIFDEVIVFIYQSSSRSAAYLSCLEWPCNTRVIANGFWDFLIPMGPEVELDLARLKLQSNVEFLAMSTSHQRMIREEYGHAFAFIPNPPPLVSDRAFADVLRQSYAMKTVRECAETVVFFPGLMSAGKGSDITVDFLRQSEANFPQCAIVARDRSDGLRKALDGKLFSRLTFAAGDFSDKEIIDLYDTADVAVLPYASEVFHFRTSGALVDCLMSSTVPVVFPNTWLAETCGQYDFGVVAEGETVDDLTRAAQWAVVDLKHQLQRMISGALRYMLDNSWQAFFAALLSHKTAEMTRSASAVRRPNMQFEELEVNLRALRAHDGMSAKARPSKIATSGETFGMMRLDPGLAAFDLISARVVLTSIGNGLLASSAEVLAQLQRDQRLSEAVRCALIELPDDDPHKGQFLRVWERFGDKPGAEASG